MDKVYEEPDEAKTEIEKLMAELRDKTDSLLNLKDSHDAQVNQIQETKFEVQKLEQELLQKADEINDAWQMYEDLKGNLNNKESIIKHISAANDTLRADCKEKFRMWEDEKRRLELELEEENEKVENQEQQIYVYRQEIESLKCCLSASNKKGLEREENLEASKELGERDDMLQKLEEENIEVEKQLKWKKEQFKHLEEAHEKLRDQFRSGKNGWELEKSTLLDEISSLQIKLDSQVRISQDLQHQLQLCNQTLAHEESQRKHLEVEVSGFKVQFDNVSSEHQDSRSQLGFLNSQLDKGNEDPRYSLKTKEAYYKESKYSIEKLEQENQDLRMSLKELQEAGESYSQSKLLSELRNLEKIHKECDSTFQAIKAEWSFQLEQLTGTINSSQTELETKTAAVEELKMELESSHSLTAEMTLLNEELSMMLLVLQQGISETQLKLSNHESEMDLINKEREEKLLQLMKQLEMKDAALMSAQNDINEERKKATCLMRQIESYAPAKELNAHKDGVGNHQQRSFQLEQLTGTINSCQTELETKTAAVEELKMELESSHSLTAEMTLLNEELSMMLLVLEQGISETQLKFSNHQSEMDLINKEREEKFLQLMKQLEMKDAALMSAQNDINEECEKAACLMRQIESYAPAKELDRRKEMLEESTKRQLLPREVLQMEFDLEEPLREVYDALDRANIELNERICERSEMELELQIWMSFVERLKNDLEENLAMRRKLENSLLAQVDFSESLKQEKDRLVCKLEEKENSIDYLQQHVVLLEQELKVRETEGSIPTAVYSKTDEVRYLQMIEEKNKILDELKKAVVLLEQESFRREVESAVIAEIKMEKTNELEKENPMTIDEVMQQVTSLEQQFTSSLTSFSSQLAEKQAEINQVQEAYDKIKAAEVQAELEIEEKKLMMVELEYDIHDIEQKLKLQEENWTPSKQLELDIEAEMDAKQFKIKDLTRQMENKLRGSDVLLQELKMENRNLLENATRLSSEKENLLRFVQLLCDKMCECTTIDAQLMHMLRSTVKSFENNSPGMNLKMDDEFLVKENMIMHSPTGTKKPETISDTRSPFKELNILLEG